MIAGPGPLPYADFVRAVAVANGQRAPRIVALPAGPLMALAGILRYIPFLPRIRPAEIRRLMEDKSFAVRPMIGTLGFTPMSLNEGLARTFTRQELTMPIINRIAEFHREMTEWRQDLHAHPELALQETRTSGVVQAKLKEFGVDEIITGWRAPAWSA